MKSNLVYNPSSKQRSRNLRKKQTPAEMLLWSRLRNRQFLNIKFRRQVPIGKFIVDFYSEELNLIIEVNGSSHDDNKFNYDIARLNYLKASGFRVLEFTEFEIKANVYNVLQTLENLIEEKI